MKYLLDTHSLIWYMDGNENLSDKVRKTIVDRHNQIFVSAISFWEIAIKTVIGKFNAKEYDLAKIKKNCLNLRIKLLPIEVNDSFAYRNLPLKKKHRDPFDRMLIATAIQNGWTLLSCDDKFDQYKEDGLKVLW